MEPLRDLQSQASWLVPIPFSHEEEDFPLVPLPPSDPSLVIPIQSAAAYQIMMDNRKMHKERIKREKLIIHNLEPILTNTFQKLFAVIESDADLKLYLQNEFKNQKEVSAGQVIDKLLSKISKYEKPPYYDHYEGQEWVWVNPYDKKTTEILDDLNTTLALLQQDIALPDRLTVQKILSANPASLTATRHTKIYYVGQTLLFSGKALLFIYREIVRLATFTGTVLMVVQSPWTGALNLILRLILR